MKYFVVLFFLISSTSTNSASKNFLCSYSHKQTADSRFIQGKAVIEAQGNSEHHFLIFENLIIYTFDTTESTLDSFIFNIKTYIDGVPRIKMRTTPFENNLNITVHRTTFNHQALRDIIELIKKNNSLQQLMDSDVYIQLSNVQDSISEPNICKNIEFDFPNKNNKIQLYELFFALQLKSTDYLNRLTEHKTYNTSSILGLYTLLHNIKLAQHYETTHIFDTSINEFLKENMFSSSIIDQWNDYLRPNRNKENNDLLFGDNNLRQKIIERYIYHYENIDVENEQGKLVSRNQTRRRLSFDMGSECFVFDNEFKFYINGEETILSVLLSKVNTINK